MKSHAASVPVPDTGASLGALFSYGFRPFFLGAALHAAIAMALWLTWIGMQAAGGGLSRLTIAGSPHVWHAHEMVLGFTTAAIAGFLLTAVPNWTGAVPLKGRPLVILFSIWLAGRVAMALSGVLPGIVVAAADLAFLPALALVAGRQLLVNPQRKNLIFLALLAVMTAGNLAYHLSALGITSRIDELAGVRAALLVVMVLTTIIGGRIVPAFTHNHLHLAAIPGPMPYRSLRLDIAAIVSMVVFAVLTLLPVDARIVGIAAAAAAAFNAWRLYGWRGTATTGAPIVLVLHVGYLWIVIGLALWALAASTGTVGEVAALHAFGSGAAGTMILAVMTRAALGHTGRRIVAAPLTVASYVLVTVAALLRSIGPALMPGHYSAVMLGAGVAWMAAFALFAVVYLPILTTPRVHERVRRP